MSGLGVIYLVQLIFEIKCSLWQKHNLFMRTYSEAVAIGYYSTASDPVCGSGVVRKRAYYLALSIRKTQ